MLRSEILLLSVANNATCTGTIIIATTHYNYVSISCTVDLVPDNLPKLLNLLVDASPEWMDLGLQLGVDQTTLRVIERDHRDMTKRCFMEMLSEWLKMIDPLPSWETLLAALESPSVKRKDLASMVMNELGIPVETENAQGKGKHV